MQDLHCTLSSCRITGLDWMKGLASHLMHASHNQWILRNFTLHDKHRGYLRLQPRKDLLRELDRLIDTPPEEVPEGSRYLLELDYSDLYNATFERQSYWVLAMKAARRAGRREKVRQQGPRKTRRPHSLKDRTNRRAPCYDFTNDDTRMERDLGLLPKPNKRMRCASAAGKLTSHSRASGETGHT